MQVSPKQLVNRRFFSGFSTITRRFSVGGAFIQAPHCPQTRPPGGASLYTGEPRNSKTENRKFNEAVVLKPPGRTRQNQKVTTFSGSSPYAILFAPLPLKHWFERHSF